MLPIIDIPTEYARWKSGGLRKQDIADRHGMTYGQLAGKFWRYEQSIKNVLPADMPRRYTPITAPWQFEWNDFMTFADVQLPHVNETWLDLSCLIAQRFLKAPRRLILAGDLVNLDAFSGYEQDGDPTPALNAEIDAAQDFFSQILGTFDEVYWLWGNHERRATKSTNGVLRPLLLAQLVLGQYMRRVQTSQRGYCFVDTKRAEWLIAHGKQYSVNQLSVAEWMSWKYQRNVVSFHEHHLANGFDRYGHYQLINGGGLFEAGELAYAVQDATKQAGMVNGFVLFQDGYPHVLGPDGFTDWRLWLPEQKSRLGGRAVRREPIAASAAK